MFRRHFQRFSTALSLLLVTLAGCGAETDPERIAAGWVLENGGQLRIDQGDKVVTIAPDSDLPDGTLNVVGVAWDIYPGDRNPRVTDAELPRFRDFPQLKSLDLWGSDITDAGLETIAQLPALEQLILTDTKITDAGLRRLQDVKKLRELSLIGTSTTKDGVAQLKRALPNCRVRN